MCTREKAAAAVRKIHYNGGLNVNSSLLSLVLHD